MTQALHITDAQANQIIRRHAINFTGEQRELDPLLDLIEDSSFVLIGEATHGTHEFYKTRIELTKRLIKEKGFNIIAAEADWPDAWQVNRYIKDLGAAKNANEALGEFQRFPTWLWRNADVLSFVEWLKNYNKKIIQYYHKVSFIGLDLYSLYRSVACVIDYLTEIDPQAAQRARLRYACLSSFGKDEQAYGYAASLGLTKACEEKVLAQLMDLQTHQLDYIKHDVKTALDEYFFVEQNAKLVSTAQAYYKQMFLGDINTWNLRDAHMMQTLLTQQKYMAQYGQKMKVVVWAHNSHLGDARATQMGQRGEFNLGQLIKETFKEDCKAIGFTGCTGTVTAASQWGGPAERKNVREPLPNSYEKLFSTIDLPSFILPLKSNELNSALSKGHLERAIGVLYLPETERYSHYFYANLPQQFDAIIHFQESLAVEPIEKTAKWVAGEDRVKDTID